MEVTGVLQMLEQSAPGTDLRPALALLASPDPIASGELNPAVRRAMLLLAAGGDPQRELELDGRAVTALAADLDRPERRVLLISGLEELRGQASGLASVAPVLDELLGEPELAWRAYACALLADELG